MHNQSLTIIIIRYIFPRLFLNNSILIFLFSGLTLSDCIAQQGSIKAIQISSNKRYFVTDIDKPFFWLGDTEWELFNLFSVSDANDFLLKRRDQGFNVIQVMAKGGFPDWSPQSTLINMKGEQAWLNDNPLTPNENYFIRMDSIVKLAEEIRMLLVVGVYHARDIEKGWITEQNVESWTKWLAQRYKNSGNIVWSMYPHAEQAAIPVVRAAVRGLIEGDSGTHLITMHPDPSPRSSSFMHSDPWLSFNTLQTWSSSMMNYDMVRSDFKKMPVKPVVNGEARYEKEAGTKPLDIRHSAYWSYLAGGFYTYGHEGNWRYQRTWREWINAPGAQQMKVLKDVFESIEWWKLVPDQTVFVGGSSDNTAAISSTRDWMMVYLPGSDNITLKLDKINASQLVTASWIDPVTGSRTIIGSYPTSGTHSFSSPGTWEDAILLLEKK